MTPMKRRLFAAAACVLASATIASAADLARPVYKAPPPPPPVFSWTGFYIGGHLGGAWGTTEVTANSASFSNFCGVLDVFSNDACESIPSSSSFGGFSVPLAQTQTNGFLGGGQGGYNWQFSNWGVIGVEGQISWTDLKGTSPCLLLLACTTSHDWIATLAGRFGVTYDRLMLYVKGGIAWAEAKYSASLDLGSFITFGTSVSDTRTGAMFGAGVEYAFLPNWSAKLEYDYITFGSRNYDFPIYISAVPVTVDIGTSIKETINLVKAGVNYHFGGPVAPSY